MAGVAIPALALNYIQGQQAEEERRRRALADAAQPDMPSRQPRAPSYAQAMGEQTRPVMPQQPPQRAASGPRQGPGAFAPQQPRPSAQAVQNAAQNAAFQRQAPTAQPQPSASAPRRVGVGGPMPSPQQAAVQPADLARAAQRRGAAVASAPAAAAGVQGITPPEPESTLASDLGAMGLAVAGERYSDMRQDDAVRRQALAGIASREAGRLGAPTYGVDAAAARARMEESDGLSYLAPLLEHYRSGGR